MVTTEEVLARLNDTLAEVASQGTKIDSINVLMDGMRAQIEDLINAIPGVPDDVLASIGQVFDAAKANTQKIDETIQENTTPEEPPVEPPVE